MQSTSYAFENQLSPNVESEAAVKELDSLKEPFHLDYNRLSVLPKTSCSAHTSLVDITTKAPQNTNIQQLRESSGRSMKLVKQGIGLLVTIDLTDDETSTLCKNSAPHVAQIQCGIEKCETLKQSPISTKHSLLCSVQDTDTTKLICSPPRKSILDLEAELEAIFHENESTDEQKFHLESPAVLERKCKSSQDSPHLLSDAASSVYSIVVQSPLLDVASPEFNDFIFEDETVNMELFPQLNSSGGYMQLF